MKAGTSTVKWFLLPLGKLGIFMEIPGLPVFTVELGPILHFTDKEIGRVPRGAAPRTLGHCPTTVRPREGAQPLAPGQMDCEGKSRPVASAGQPALSLHHPRGAGPRQGEFLVTPSPRTAESPCGEEQGTSLKQRGLRPAP